jgi:hypothetical protein
MIVWLILERLEHVGPGAARELEDKAIVIVAQIEQIEITRPRHHEAMEVILDSI